MIHTIEIPETFDSAKLEKCMKQLELAERKREAGVPLEKIFPGYKRRKTAQETMSIEEQVASSLVDISNSDFTAVNLNSPQARKLFCVKAKISRTAKKASSK